MTYSTLCTPRSTLKLWCRAVRPYAYPASIVPALLGTALAWSEGIKVRLDLALLTLIGVIAAHTAGNLINDYEDFRRGIDRPGTLGGNGLLVSGEMTLSQTLVGAFVALAVALICGVPLIIHAGWPIAALMIAGALAAMGYGFSPFGFKYRALGDFTVFMAFGVGITLGSYMVQSLTFSWKALAISIPYALWVVAILHANNTRDLGDDRDSSFKTLAGHLGDRLARRFYTTILIVAYALPVAFVIAGIAPAGVLLVFLSAPLAVRLVRMVASYDPAFLSAAVPQTAQFSLPFGLLLTVGLFI